MKERFKRILSVLMAFCMILTTGIPVSASEVLDTGTTESIEEETGITAYADISGDAIEDGTYAILSKSINKAVNITKVGYQNPAKVEAVYYPELQKFEDNVAQFNITKIKDENNEITVYIEFTNVDDETFPLVKEDGGVVPNGAFINNLDFNGGQTSYNNNCKFILKKKTDNNGFIIQAAAGGRFATVGTDGYLAFEENTIEDTAEEFLFIKNPAVIETSFSIEHKESSAYIRTYGTNGEALTVDGEKGKENTKFNKIVFGTYNERVVVSLVSKGYGNGIKSGGVDTVNVDGGIAAYGYESIRVIPNGDGTISFRDSLNDRYITVEEIDGKKVLVCNKVNIGTTYEQLTNNEKFIVHTMTSPSSISEPSVSEESDTSIKLSWKNPECLFTNIIVYYKKSNADWNTKKTKNLTSDEIESQSCIITGLDKNAEYNFKLKVILHNGENELESPESKEITAYTNNTSEPTQEPIVTEEPKETPAPTDAPEETQVPAPTQAPEDDTQILQFSKDSKYGIISGSNAINITNIGYQNHAKVNANYKDNKFIGDNVEFVITPQDSDKTKVMIQCLVGGKKYPLRTETVNNYAFADNEGEGNNGRYDGAEIYIIKKTGENEGTIQAVSNNRYATIDNGELRFAEDTVADNAMKFLFIENPTVLDTAFSIEHKKSGKYIKTYETANEPLTVDGEKGEEDTKFSQVVFGTEANRVTVSLISKLYNKGIQSGNLTNVVVHNNINGNGWESIRIIPNGDGTISFRDSKDDKYITVKETDGKKVLACNEPDIGTADHPLTDNEKFIIHTEIPPEPVTGLKVDEKGGSATSVKLSWTNPECLFTGIDVLQKNDSGIWEKIVGLANAESYKVTGLTEGKEYTFKIRVAIGTGEDALYAESEEVKGTPKANENIIQFSEDSTYGIVSGGKAINITDIGWANHAQVNAAHKENNKIEGDNVKFIITPQDVYTELAEDETQVIIESIVGEDKYPFRTEGENNYSFADSDKRYDGEQEAYIIKKTGTNEGTIQGVKNKRYATVDNGELRFAVDTTLEQATKFTFIENPEVTSSNPGQTTSPGGDTPAGNLNVSIEHVGTNKYIQTKAAGEDITVNGNADDEDVIFNNIIFGESGTNTDSGKSYSTISFVSKKYNTGFQSAIWNNDRGAADASVVKATNTITGNEWETIRTSANGDGTISFKDTFYDKLITVESGKLAGEKIDKGISVTDNEKFKLHIADADKEALTPKQVAEFVINDSSRTETTLDLSWKNPTSIFTGIELYQKKTDETDYTKIKELGDVEEYKVTGLQKGVSYDFKLRVICAVSIDGQTEILASSEASVSATTRAGVKPDTPSNVRLEETDGKFKLTWDSAANAKSYKIQSAPSLYGEYKDLGSAVTGTTTEVTPEKDKKYGTYYRIVAVNVTELSDPSKSVSLETNIFGDHTIFFADTDDVKKIDEVLMDIFNKGNDFDNDAQFNGEQWQIYFKPGDYTETSCMHLGFYTSFNGLGKTPYDVKLNNIAIPAYLPVGSLGSSSPFNATCNFWRSAENLSIINTGNPALTIKNYLC